MRRAGTIGGGAWHGNDTCWRMAADLTRIVHYADRQGRLHDVQQRRNLMLIDGVVAGEGNGPLAPTAARAGTLLFSDDVARGDRVACRLMGFDPDHIPLVREVQRIHGPTAPGGPVGTIRLNGSSVTEPQIAPVLGRPFRPPHGWLGRLGNDP